MKKKLLLFPYVLVYCFAAFAQSPSPQYPNMPSPKSYRTKLGLKAGFNWSYVTADQSGVNLNSKSGYMLGAFLAPPSKGGLGFRTEIVYSRQGYNYDNGGRNTDVINQYIYLPQLTTFNIGKFFQLQLGAQIGYLINAKKTTSDKDSSITDLMNRFDYGFAGGVELNPIAGLIIGARYNLGLGKLYKHYEQSATNPNPFPLPFDPQTVNLKNGVIQLFAGYKF